MTSSRVAKELKDIRREAVVLLDLVSRTDMMANSMGLDRAIYFSTMLHPIAVTLAKVNEQLALLEPDDQMATDVEYEVGANDGN